MQALGFVFRVFNGHVGGEYPANEHGYVLIHCAYAREYGAHEKDRNDRVDDAYHYEGVNECGLPFYEDEYVNVFHCLSAIRRLSSNPLRGTSPIRSIL